MAVACSQANSVSGFQGCRVRGALVGCGRNHGVIIDSEDERSGQQEVGTGGLGGGGADGVMRKHKCSRKLRLTPRPSVTLHTLFLRISHEAVRLGTPNIISSEPEPEHGAPVNQQANFLNAACGMLACDSAAVRSIHAPGSVWAQATLADSLSSPRRFSQLCKIN